MKKEEWRKGTRRPGKAQLGITLKTSGEHTSREASQCLLSWEEKQCGKWGGKPAAGKKTNEGKGG